MPREDALNRLTSNLDKILQFGVERIGLFGSPARSDAGPESDVDVLVRFPKGSNSLESFVSDRTPFDAIVRDIEIIGQAAKALPESICA